VSLAGDPVHSRLSSSHAIKRFPQNAPKPDAVQKSSASTSRPLSDNRLSSAAANIDLAQQTTVKKPLSSKHPQSRKKIDSMQKY
ncbi:unnamed protein product, partial [Didymodactylos carnosus]